MSDIPIEPGSRAFTGDAGGGFSRLAMTLQALAAVADQEGAAELLVGEAVRAVGADAGVLAVLADGVVRVLASTEPGDVPLEAYPVEQAVAGEAVWVTRYPAGRSLGELATTAACLPLRAGDVVVGVLGLWFPGDATPNEDQLVFLAAVADTAGLVLRARQVPASATPPPPEDTQIRALSETLIRNAPLGIALIGPDLRYRLVNDALAGMNGVPAADHVGRALHDVVPSIAETAEPTLRHVLETGEPILDWNIEGETPAAPGILRWWTESIYRVELPTGEVLGVATIVRETTEQRRRTDAVIGLARYAEALAVAVNTDEVGDAVRTHLPAVFDAPFVNLALLGRDRPVVRIGHPDTLDPTVAHRYETLPLDAPTPLTDAIRTGQLTTIADTTTPTGRYTDLATDALTVGLLGLAAVPLPGDGPDTVGAIGVGWPEPLTADTTRLDQLEAVADLTAGALARTETTDVQAALVAELQSHLLPHIPRRPGLDIAVRYRPARPGIGFGGDWYNVISLDDARTAIIIGDIAGHGIEAAAQMAVVRGAIGAAIRLGVPLPDVFPATDALIDIRSDFLATAFVAIIDTDTHTLHHSRAGHPPALLRTPDGTIHVLEAGNSTVLGIPHRRRAAATEPFAPGSVLVAYTDGLIERRRENIDLGINRLTRALTNEHATGDADDISDTIITRLIQSELADDAAVVTVCFTTPPHQPTRARHPGPR